MHWWKSKYLNRFSYDYYILFVHRYKLRILIFICLFWEPNSFNHYVNKYFFVYIKHRTIHYFDNTPLPCSVLQFTSSKTSLLTMSRHLANHSTLEARKNWTHSRWRAETSLPVVRDTSGMQLNLHVKERHQNFSNTFFS